MRKIFILLTVSLFFMESCSDIELDNIESDSFVQSNIRSFDEALQIARTSVDEFETQILTRSASQKRCISDCKVIKSVSTRSKNNGIDTLMYVFNFNDNLGFVIVAAPKCVEGLLAFTENGYYDPDIPSDVEGFNDFVKSAKQYCLNSFSNSKAEKEDYNSVIRSPVGGTEEYMDSVWYVSSIIVTPLVYVRWGQRFPEGEMCINGFSGCTNTAIAQIMSYYEYPDTIQLTYSDADKAFETLNWDNMKSHSTRHVLADCGTADVHTSISRLLRELGELNHSSYRYDGTATFTSLFAVNTLNNLGYSTGEWNDYSSLGARLSLNKSRPLLITGSTDYNAAHAWVLDGYGTQKKYVQRMRRINNSNWFPIGSPRSTTSYYMHYNWGWYGYCNGYFLSGIFDTSEGFGPDMDEDEDKLVFGNVKMLSIFR